jgi:hypothetical protein
MGSRNKGHVIERQIYTLVYSIDELRRTVCCTDVRKRGIFAQIKDQYLVTQVSGSPAPIYPLFAVVRDFLT